MTVPANKSQTTEGQCYSIAMQSMNDVLQSYWAAGLGPVAIQKAGPKGRGKVGEADSCWMFAQLSRQRRQKRGHRRRGTFETSSMREPV